MIFTKALKYEDIIEKLDKENDIITIIGCNTCVRVSGAGGEKRLNELAKKLVDDGYNVEGGYIIPASCTPKALFVKLDRRINTVIALSCSAGFANITRIFEDQKVIPSVEDIGLMIENSDEHIVKITMPYEGHEDEYGKEYEALTGLKKASDDNLKFKEARK